MYYMALATDYDGTLADHGTVRTESLEALKRLRETGRKLLLVTGRELPDLKRVFPQTDLFDKIVAENGALLYTPETEEERPLAPAPPAEFVDLLREKGVDNISVGRTIVATWEPHQTAVLEAIHELGLELEIIFNKGAVMVLPSGVNKASGLKAALKEMQLSFLNVVAVGDAENDHALLRMCGCGAAVANALPAVKDTADFALEGARGEGVEELIGEIIAQDFAFCTNARHQVQIGENDAGPVVITPPDVLLITGSSGIGKSTLATALSERLREQSFQFCVFDPEGDYEDLEGAVTVGSGSVTPTNRQVLELLANPEDNVVVSALGFELQERPGFFAELMPDISAMRARTGRPHWLIIDEAHHLMPAARDSASLALSDDRSGTIMITVHPDSVSPKALSAVTAVAALGPKGREAIESFCEATGDDLPEGLDRRHSDEEVLFWRRSAGAPAQRIRVEKPKQVRKRHTRKYAEGHLGEDASFYFRGPEKRLNLRAHNLMMFLQIAEGVDDETWDHHLRAGDYSKWFGERIGDPELADEAAALEEDRSLAPAESRKRLAEAVRRRYTAPASEKD
ncbi:HAD family hydrolase [Sinorhizobium alkalisoli]|uniref:Phosphoglycolate phosphatase n=1 Tax=Sinorhizobium alkalisoli TaxID=1752398 RepID=A0A1E3VFU8_9HYPH|nr:HAD-IIB family hydrolase [Sinorhizobium alkalisoli]MCA1491802.1 HAD-IIB family hydrolase [Ensifer sp. NBAIM29]ODR92414.1 phosphoglycolate phosphatase [Sinorhizobium alkalisoli]QFI66892.1 Phosphoglycolate phosphatase, archaeal type [Sinorhizobium alkalisoli]